MSNNKTCGPGLQNNKFTLHIVLVSKIIPIYKYDNDVILKVGYMGFNCVYQLCFAAALTHDLLCPMKSVLFQIYQY